LDDPPRREGRRGNERQGKDSKTQQNRRFSSIQRAPRFRRFVQTITVIRSPDQVPEFFQHRDQARRLNCRLCRRQGDP
jgi:hypothetical protein